MKKIAAILLSAILLFNWVGYRLLVQCLQSRANMQLEAQLDNDNYDESQLIAIKIPAAHLPYYTNSKQYERVYGEIEIENVQYKYVKQRLYNDSIELLCIPNHKGMKLQTAKDDFFKLVNDLQHTGQGKKTGSYPGASKFFSIDYYAVSGLFKLNDLNFAVSKKSYHYFVTLPYSFLFVAEQPPEIIA